MLPLIVRPALLELAGAAPGSPEFNTWVGQLFYLPAVAGGIFGLLGGYLTDVLGRRRVLVWSILLYAFSAMAAGYATTPGWLLLFRCTTFIGVSVEFVAAVAWLAELFPDPKQRESVLGYTQAFSSIGGLLVTGAYALSVKFAESLPEIQGGHEAWRYTLISGVIPALPLMIIRPFLPESPEWARKKAEGTLKRASIGELFAPEFRRTTIVTTIMFACSYGAAFGAIQHLPRIVPGLVADLARPAQELQVSGVQAFQEIGGLIGRFVLALLVVRIVSRRSLIRVFQIPGLVVMPFVFWYAAVNDLTLLKYSAFLIGLLTVAQFSFWGNYLPGVYPVYLRGTGEGFAANIGGRMLGTSAAWVTTTLATAMPLGATPPEKLAFAAGLVGLSAYVIGFASSFFLPEPKHVEGVH
ncbi:MAG: MFS transporter [Acidobacteria bacterium]|nr:MFS transporter [Acidobacteriota bacterium]